MSQLILAIEIKHLSGLSAQTNNLNINKLLTDFKGLILKVCLQRLIIVNSI